MEMRAMYAQCLGELMERDEKLILLDADLSKACGTFPLRKRFPDRIYDCGVAEQNMISIAAGLASYDYKPWAESFAPFATRRVCDQIAISVCYAKRNVKIVGTDPGIAAELNGGTICPWRTWAWSGPFRAWSSSSPRTRCSFRPPCRSCTPMRALSTCA